MEKYKKFIAEYKKDFLLPRNLFTKEKDIFLYLFQLLREKINKGRYPEVYNDEIIYSKSDLKNLILKGIILFKSNKRGWMITINPTYITKNVECSWCGAKFNEKIYFKQKRMRCPSCMSGMNGSTIIEKFEDNREIKEIEILHDKEIKEEINDIEVVRTDIEKIQACNKIIPFRTSKADSLNAISAVNRIAEKKEKKRIVTTQEKILANFSDTAVNFIREYFFIYNHTIFSTMKYMNIGLQEIRKDPRFIANASLKNNILTEVKTACDELLTACHPSQPNEHATALKLS